MEAIVFLMLAFLLGFLQVFSNCFLFGFCF